MRQKFIFRNNLNHAIFLSAPAFKKKFQTYSAIFLSSKTTSRKRRCLIISDTNTEKPSSIVTNAIDTI